MNKPSLSVTDYRAVAMRLGCETAAIRAFAYVESPRGPFEPDGAPTVLFERHKFHMFTKGAYDKVAPDLSNPVAGGYGPSSAQHSRLARAAKLDRNAALRATSWGQFQLMGFNYDRCGYSDLQAFINAMYRSARDQLDAFCAFIESDPALKRAVVTCDWPTAAKLYNGPAYARNQYDTKMAAAYRSFAGGV